MAIIYADTYGYEQATGGYVPKHPVPVAKGQEVVIAGTLTCTAALASGDFGYLADIPQYAELSYYLHWYSDWGTTCTTEITYCGTDIMASIALGTAVANTAAVGLSATLATVTGKMGTTYALATSSTSNIVKLTFTTVSTPTAGATYRFRMGIFLP